MNELAERKALNEQFTQVQIQKQEMESQYHHRVKVIDQLPLFLNSIEQASIPFQQFLNVNLTEDFEKMKIRNNLPLALSTLYHKLVSFCKDYPQFGFQVEAKGDEE